MAPAPRGNTPYPETGHAGTHHCQSRPRAPLTRALEQLEEGGEAAHLLGAQLRQPQAIASQEGSQSFQGSVCKRTDAASGRMLCIRMGTTGQGCRSWGRWGRGDTRPQA